MGSGQLSNIVLYDLLISWKPSHEKFCLLQGSCTVEMCFNFKQFYSKAKSSPTFRDKAN